MRLVSVGRVEVNNSPDLNSNADFFVCGKEVLIFNDYDWEVTVTGWDPEGATKSLRIVSAALGYNIPETPTYDCYEDDEVPASKMPDIDDLKDKDDTSQLAS
jgi:hypothetical protein